jgi:histidinol-phosphatase (PHP family)
MRYSCLHTHTTFCDGHDSIETCCRAAWQGGFESIGFSAHAPLGKKTGLSSDWHLPDERLTEYLDAVQDARRRWAGRLAVYLGLETDYIRGSMGPADPDYREMGLDYTIGSVHYIFPPDGGKPVTVDSSPAEFEENLRRRFGGDGEALMEIYWDTLEEMIRAGGFDILGHADIIKKNNPGEKWFSMTGERYQQRLIRAAEAIARSGVVTEVNTGAINRGTLREPYPSRSFLELLQKRAVPVTITADAHRASHLGGHYDTARETLLAAGYTRIMFFEGRQGNRPVWTGDPL